jgi:hypothetical protein
VQKLVTIYGLSELNDVPVRSLRTLVQKRIIPFIKVGHRTMLFAPEKVERALAAYEVKPINRMGGDL